VRACASLLLFLALAIAAGLILGLNGCGDNPSDSQHVIVIFQENRTPDNLFQDPVLKSRGADIADRGINSKGETIPLQKIVLGSAFDVDHSHYAFLAMYADGAMTGADRVTPICKAEVLDCIPTHPQFSYVDPAEVQPYFQMAEQYTFGDRMFQTNQGPSFPAHQFIIAGTSAPASRSPLFASENPHSFIPTTDEFINLNAGCVAPPYEYVNLIDPTGTANQTMYPCFDHVTLIDLLEAKGISWRYYAPSQGSIWTGPNAIQHICQPQPKDGTTVCTGSLWSNVTFPQTEVLKDIIANRLPEVSWVIPDGPASDHAGNTGANLGPSWVASIVNAIGNSPYWKNTTIIVTWDDWGGWYDHVAPKVINSYEYGFRVPLIVISPYAQRGYISHVTHDFGSILKFIEKKYGLPSLGYADAMADDLSDCFDYNQTPATFQTIPAPIPMDHFLNLRRPSDGSNPDPDLDPDDD
jgi:phospholipase C